MTFPGHQPSFPLLCNFQEEVRLDRPLSVNEKAYLRQSMNRVAEIMKISVFKIDVSLFMIYLIILLLAGKTLNWGAFLPALAAFLFILIGSLIFLKHFFRRNGEGDLGGHLYRLSEPVPGGQNMLTGLKSRNILLPRGMKLKRILNHSSLLSLTLWGYPQTGPEYLLAVNGQPVIEEAVDQGLLKHRPLFFPLVLLFLPVLLSSLFLMDGLLNKKQIYRDYLMSRIVNRNTEEAVYQNTASFLAEPPVPYGEFHIKNIVLLPSGTSGSVFYILDAPLDPMVLMAAETYTQNMEKRSEAFSVLMKTPLNDFGNSDWGAYIILSDNPHFDPLKTLLENLPPDLADSYGTATLSGFPLLDLMDRAVLNSSGLITATEAFRSVEYDFFRDGYSSFLEESGIDSRLKFHSNELWFSFSHPQELLTLMTDVQDLEGYLLDTAEQDGLILLNTAIEDVGAELLVGGGLISGTVLLVVFFLVQCLRNLLIRLRMKKLLLRVLDIG